MDIASQEVRRKESLCVFTVLVELISGRYNDIGSGKCRGNSAETTKWPRGYSDNRELGGVVVVDEEKV